MEDLFVINLSPDVRKKIERMKRELNVKTDTDFFKIAGALTEVCVNAISEGNKVCVVEGEKFYASEDELLSEEGGTLLQEIIFSKSK